MKLTENFSKLITKIKQGATNHAPELLAGTGIGLWILSSIDAVSVTPKAYADIEKKKEHLTKSKLSAKETVQTVWKYYVMPVTGAAIGTTCIIASVTTSNKRYLALSSAYEFANESFQIYKDKVIETVGEKKEQQIQDKVAQERLERRPLENSSQVIVTGNGESLCYDSFSGRYFKFNIGDIKKVENKVNERIIHMNYVSLNEMYGYLGLEYIDMGYELGWNSDMVPSSSLFEFRISYKGAKDGTPCMVLDYNVAPQTKYDMFG